MNALDPSSFGPKKARVEIIPLIDVIFFLLATFVLFTLSLSKIGAIDVPFPISTPQPGVDRTAYIQASADGTFYWKQGQAGVPEMITANELGPRLQYYKNNDMSPRVFVRGDDKAKYGPTIAIFDEALKAGITQVSIETVPSQTGR
ncbi:MAG: biopolymer transporter ExbD [Verrucomicrobia bacterium]|nr:biopolymer transporter ExbD [Verrucomicrobiota bacterium]